MQSGSNKVLKAMHRAYTAEKIVTLSGEFGGRAAALRLQPTSSSGFPARPTTTTGRHAIWSRKSSSTTHLCFAIRRGTTHRPRRCPIKSTNNQGNAQSGFTRNGKQIEPSEPRTPGRKPGGSALRRAEQNKPARLMGRTRTNKIVVFPPSPNYARDQATRGTIGELVDVRVERANGFSLYGTPPIEYRIFNRKLKTCATVSKLTRHQWSSTHDLPSLFAHSRNNRGAFLVLVGVLGLVKPDFAQVVKQLSALPGCRSCAAHHLPGLDHVVTRHHPDGRIRRVSSSASDCVTNRLRARAIFRG